MNKASPTLDNPISENPTYTKKDTTKTNRTKKEINKKGTTTKNSNDPRITSEVKQIIDMWNKTFDIVVDRSDKKLMKAIAKRAEEFDKGELLQAIKFRSQSAFYKDDYPNLRDNPKSFFQYPQTIKNDMNRRPYKLITYEQKCELEMNGTNKQFEIDPARTDKSGKPKWRMHE